MGKTSRLIKKRIYEHKSVFKKVDVKNAVGRHNFENNHNFNLKDFKIWIDIHKFPTTKKQKKKKKKKYWKIAFFSNQNTNKQILGFFNLSPYLVKLVMKGYKITNFK